MKWWWWWGWGRGHSGRGGLPIEEGWRGERQEGRQVGAGIEGENHDGVKWMLCE